MMTRTMTITLFSRSAPKAHRVLKGTSSRAFTKHIKRMTLRCISAGTFVLAALVVSGCGGVDDTTGPVVSTTPNETDNFRRTLSATATGVVLPTYTDFANAAAELASDSGALAQYCDAIGTADESNALSGARSAHQNVFGLWQQAEAFLIGPVTDNSNNIRNRLYSWPDFVSTCTVDRNVVLAQDGNYNIDTAPRQGLGLDTLEYLLYATTVDHTCPSQITETQSWNLLGETDRKTTRCAYARLVAQDLLNTANNLVAEWDTAGNDYATALSESGFSESGAFDSQADALNALSDALFYLEKEVKDRKLGVPLGLHNDCLSTTCPEAVESSLSNQGLAHIRQNILGFKALFLASRTTDISTNPISTNPISTKLSFEEISGFNYILATRNFVDVSDDIINRTDAALARIDHYTGTLNGAITAVSDSDVHANCVNASTSPDITLDPDSPLNLCALHGTLKGITDQLRGNFLTIVSLALPQRVEGDSD